MNSQTNTKQTKARLIKKPVESAETSLLCSNFVIPTLPPPPPFFNICCKQVKVSTQRTATLKRGRGGLAIDKKDVFFFKLRKDTDKKRLFCSNVSTLLSMTVGQKAYTADLLPYFDNLLACVCFRRDNKFISCQIFSFTTLKNYMPINLSVV